MSRLHLAIRLPWLGGPLPCAVVDEGRPKIHLPPLSLARISPLLMTAAILSFMYRKEIS